MILYVCSFIFNDFSTVNTENGSLIVPTNLANRSLENRLFLDAERHLEDATRRRIKYEACQWVEKRQNCIALEPSGTGKTHVALALGLTACQKGHSVAFMTAAGSRAYEHGSPR